MHDIRLIRDDPAAFDAAMARRGLEPQSPAVLALDEQKRNHEKLHQFQLAERNRTAKEIGAAKASGDLARYEELRQSAQLRADIGDSAAELATDLELKLRDALAALPNRPADDVPDGEDESGNVELKAWGHKHRFNYTPANHADMGPALGLDFETGAALSGARFTFLRGQMARLQRALGQFMLDLQTANDFQECVPPLIVKDEAMFGTGQLPKFASDSFETDLSLHQDTLLFWQLNELDKLKEAGKAAPEAFLGDPDVLGLLPKPPTRRWLIPTSEVSLTNSVREKILADAELPIRLTALTPCFRSEAGAAGKDTRGYIRQHQFEKVELVTICRPEDSEAEHEKMVLAAESVLEALDLPYRRMLLCAGDMGFSARKTYDLEVWLPGQDAYREISSVSNCGDFQARRMNARLRVDQVDGTKKHTRLGYVHTLNGSGLAVGRTLVAVLENYQQEDGSVHLPAALHPYMGGVTRLEPTR